MSESKKDLKDFLSPSPVSGYSIKIVFFYFNGVQKGPFIFKISVFSPEKSRCVIHFRQPNPESPDNPEFPPPNYWGFLVPVDWNGHWVCIVQVQRPSTPREFVKFPLLCENSG